VGETARQQWHLRSIPPYLEELVEKEGKPVRQHLLSHRLGPREARRRRTSHIKPNHVPEAPKLPAGSTQLHPGTAQSQGWGSGAGRQRDAWLTARQSPDGAGDREPSDTRQHSAPCTWCKLQPGAVNRWDLQRCLAVRDSKVTMAGKLQLSPQSHPASSLHIVPKIISNFNTMAPNHSF